MFGISPRLARKMRLRPSDNMMLLQNLLYCPLNVIVCLIVFMLVKMLISYGRKSSRIMRAQRMWPIKNIIFSGEELSSFKQLPNENAHDMYSRLNIFINEINALGLNQVEDWEINQKILRSIRKPDYDIINSLLQKEDLVNLTPNQVINQIIAHEYSMGMTKKKEQESTSSSSHKSLAAKHSCKHQPRRQNSSSSIE